MLLQKLGWPFRVNAEVGLAISCKAEVGLALQQLDTTTQKLLLHRKDILMGIRKGLLLPPPVMEEGVGSEYWTCCLLGSTLHT